MGMELICWVSQFDFWVLLMPRFVLLPPRIVGHLHCKTHLRKCRLQHSLALQMNQVPLGVDTLLCMSSFDILSVADFIFIYRRVLDPLIARLRKPSP
ncbi:hypothetical protein HYC85_030334 [Camellia sinensis]|uniref:Uncharacterized protein n=1 Tax=Camellia sinensis TaxID=4442 RepID=A0A7J7G0F6_CAMSI|nr:hypothetical protein HYC85_030334 [Camellia sinensis]